MNLKNQRPGVYSQYTTLSRYGTPRSEKGVGLLCPLDDTLENKVLRFESYFAANEVLGTNFINRFALKLCQILFSTGVSFVVLVNSNPSFHTSLTLLEQEENLGILVVDAKTDVQLEETISSVEKSSKERKERLCFFGAETAEKALHRASVCNHPRAMMVAPQVQFEESKHPLFAPCALAGILASANKPNYNLNGAHLPFLSLSTPLAEDEVQELIKGGVTPLEMIGKNVECIRGVTTCTKVNGNNDYSYRSINTTLIIDDVLSTIRTRLKSRLQGAQTISDSYDSIASQVLVELHAKKQEGLLEHYEIPYVYPQETDPSVCVVELSFTIAHMISQIYITTKIQL